MSAALRGQIFDEVAARFLSSSIVSRQELLDFTVGGESMPLIDRSRGIRNPKPLEATLSVVSSADGPYADEEVSPGIWRYDFRAGGSGGDNRKLIAAHRLGVPVLLFRKLQPNVYQIVYPARVAHVNEAESHVLISLEELSGFSPGEASVVERGYAEYLAKRRVHQPAFRAMVMRAYDTQCTVCRFKHGELLDAAHITADSSHSGDATVTNGMAMCKIHHAAYDANFLGVSPDYEIRINARLLDEVDGPMLRHGLQEMHGVKITLPARRAEQPDRERLAERFEVFTRG
ncbi:HNH endonuclease [Demequina sp. B12]|uniref:HNH endonuclease n=1 Tax=Demequina sp. B12 TaxID=2992757 RepID=UPI00237C16D4|nr:HNH endonuclease [Demequina sp. B12]MDE0572708.1 HNH endonuclease [Demequina sp. B12]